MVGMLQIGPVHSAIVGKETENTFHVIRSARHRRPQSLAMNSVIFIDTARVPPYTQSTVGHNIVYLELKLIRSGFAAHTWPEMLLLNKNGAIVDLGCNLWSFV